MEQSSTEKGLDSALEQPVGHISDEDIQWSEEEERRLVRKVDLIVMPLLTLGFFGLQLDRGNVGNALTDFFLVDVGITQNEYNIGQQLLSLGIILLEIPSNLILYRLGPTLWIGAQILAWGSVATFQAFIKGKGLGPYLATRLLLGLCEAGFIPASLYTLSRWYKRDEISKRFSWFFLGNLLAAALAGIIAFGILRMRGIAGLTGWQWLFIIEGTFTILVGILFLVTFPSQVSQPVSLLGYRYFNERESRILTQRVIQDDPGKAVMRRHVSKEELVNVLTNWRLLPHMLLTICGIAPSSAFNSYAPTLVNSFGYGRLQSNALISIAYWILLFSILLWGWFADKTGVRGPFISLGLLLFFLFNIGNRAVVASDNPALRFGILTASIAISWPWHPVNGSWLSLNSKTPGERSITMAVHIMAANCGGLVGSQIFRSDDLPLYWRGWTIIMVLSSAALFFSIVANLQYYLGNGRKLQKTGVRYFY